MVTPAKRDTPRNTELLAQEFLKAREKWRWNLEHQDTNLPSSVFFKDGMRKIDYILVYNKRKPKEVKDRVNTFIYNLENFGLQFEGVDALETKHLYFIKVHLNIDVLLKYAFLQNIHLSFESQDDYYNQIRTFNVECTLTDLTFPDERSIVYKRAPESVSGNKPSSATTAERIMITDYLLNQAKFGDDIFDFGLKRMLHFKYLKAAYPIHDGTYEWTTTGPLNDRQLLKEYWANVMMAFKIQPIDLIQKYFGHEVAFYFAFLGVYNKMLISAALFGFVVLFYGIVTFYTDTNMITRYICNSTSYVCPYCRFTSICKYIPVKSSCALSKLAYIMDNWATTIYAIIMCFWAAYFLKMWRREQIILMYKWNLLDLEYDISIRPEYSLKTKKRKVSTHTGELEPYVPLEQQLACTCLSISVVIISIFVVISAVIGIITIKYLLRLFILQSSGAKDNFVIELMPTIIAGVINLTVMMLFDRFYDYVAKALTDLENHRTQLQYDNYYTYKVYVICFLNAYAFLFYIALFKGRFYTQPEYSENYNYEELIKSDVCSVHGCVVEVAFHLMIMMIGKSCIVSIVEIAKPYVMKRMRRRKLLNRKLPPWEDSYYQEECDYYFLFTDYKDMVIQYGFVIMFAAACPLSPLIGLIYNLMELRVDAYKFVKYFRRPVPTRVKGIGAWNNILSLITIFGFITNAFLIAFTTRVLSFALAESDNDIPYIESTYSVFDTKDFKQPALKSDIPYCMYFGRRLPPWDPEKYEYSKDHWVMLTMRFLIVFAIECFVLCFAGLLAFIIPNCPRSIEERIKQKEIIEMERRKQRILGETKKESEI